MSDARSIILQRIRHALGGDDNPPNPTQRLRSHTRGPLPKIEGDLTERFCEKLTAAAATWEALDQPSQLGKAVAAYLQSRGLAPQLVAGLHPLLQETTWPPPLTVSQRAAEGTDVAAITVAVAGIAETGTLLFSSGPNSPATLNFLPEFCLGVVARARIVPYLEDACELLCQERKHLPRAIHLVTGPSRTADVEQTLQLGAHGPRQLHVFIVGD